MSNFNGNQGGFFSALFDFSFTEFIIPKVIKYVYLLAILLAVGSALVFIVTGFAKGILYGLVCLVLSPLVLLLYIIVARIYMEMIVVLFKVEENTAKMARK